MKEFLSGLYKRNRILFIYGWITLLGAIICILLMQLDSTIVLGINAWIKPMKFFFSIAIFSWTMNWYMYYLERQNHVRLYSWIVVLIMTYELTVICWQAANGRSSHFNNTSALYALLFFLMGIAISILVIWTGYIGYLFFRQKTFRVPMVYIWGIRLGIVLFVFFSSQGGIMVQHHGHTVGGADGVNGLPFVNWSREYGDLRIAHFLGMHALQIIPLVSYYAAKKRSQVILFSLVYFIVVLVLLIRAMMGLALM